MNPKRLIQYLLAGGIIFLAIVLIGAFLLPWKRINWGTFSWGPSFTVTVMGEAQTQEENRKATFSAGINTVKDKKEQAIAEVNTTISAITEAAKKFGIKDEDVKTENLSIFQEDEAYTEGGKQKHRLGQWRVGSSVTITLRDVSRAGALADTLSAAGANNVYGPNFALDDQSQSGTILLSKAVEDARKKAELLANASGKKLGGIISITEGSTSQGGLRMAAVEGMGGADLKPGTQTVSKSVTVTFGLTDPTLLETIMGRITGKK